MREYGWYRGDSPSHLGAESLIFVTCKNISRLLCKNFYKCKIHGADEMKEKLSGYLTVLFEQNAESVGGALPVDAFYYSR